MYITINDVIGEKTIDLSYPIYPENEIAVVSMFSNNSQILLKKSMEVLLYTGKKIVLNKGVYTDRELDSLIGTELKSQMLDSSDDVLRVSGQNPPGQNPPGQNPPGQNPSDKIPLDKIPPRTKSPQDKIPLDKIPPVYFIFY